MISPSVLAADFSRLAEDVAKVEKAGAEYLHLDVMDGIFVPNISFGAPVISSLRKHSKMVFDVHLMITDPIRYVDDFVKAGADIITIHYESCDDPLSVVRYIHSKGVKAAVSIKPATPPELLFPMMSELDMLLVMTVHPGFAGQKIIPNAEEKVSEAKALLNELNINIPIQVDGNMSLENGKKLCTKGADIFVLGTSALFLKDKSITDAAEDFRAVLI
jgi:ribulose-phosphate 3-epimerase